MANGKKKSKKKLFIFGGIGLLLLIVVILVISAGGKEEIILVQVEEVKTRNITQTVSATGKIYPEYQVVVTPEVTGEIVALPVKEGDRVRKGDILIKIKADAYVAQRQRAEANLQSAKANLNMRKAELDKVEQDYNRIKELHSKKLASDAELENVKSLYLSSKAMYEGATANVLQSEAALKETLEQLYKTTIYSPISGTITQLNVELGERVLGSGFSQGTNIMTVSDLSSMEARVEVDENDVVLVSLGDTAKVKVDAFGDKRFTGIVTQIGNSAKSSGFGTQEQVVNFEVRIRLINPETTLRPGMSCNADIETETVFDVVSVPIQSVTSRDKSFNKKEEETDGPDVKVDKKQNDKIQEVVFIIEGNKAKQVNVTTGISDDNYIHIKSGLKGGEKVVNGSYRAISRDLKDGSLVKVDEKKDKKTEIKN